MEKAVSSENILMIHDMGNWACIFLCCETVRRCRYRRFYPDVPRSVISLFLAILSLHVSMGNFMIREKNSYLICIFPENSSIPHKKIKRVAKAN